MPGTTLIPPDSLEPPEPPAPPRDLRRTMRPQPPRSDAIPPELVGCAGLFLGACSGAMASLALLVVLVTTFT